MNSRENRQSISGQPSYLHLRDPFHSKSLDVNLHANPNYIEEKNFQGSLLENIAEELWSAKILSLNIRNNTDYLFAGENYAA